MPVYFVLVLVPSLNTINDLKTEGQIFEKDCVEKCCLCDLHVNLQLSRIYLVEFIWKNR